MQKMQSRRVFDMEAGGIAERPMGARLPRSMSEVHEYFRLSGMNDQDARRMVQIFAEEGVGISHEELECVRQKWFEHKQAMADRQAEVDARAEAAALRSPNTPNAIRSRERRQAQQRKSRRTRK